MQYFKSTFVTDVLSFVPKIFDWGSGLYLLKGIRIFHYFR